jgi:choline dehydrogenase-like flavoprotein
VRLSGNTVEPELTRRVQAVVVGTGPGGSTVAKRLADAGLDVMMVEAGAYVPAREFSQREGEMMRKLYREAGLRTTDNGAMAMLHGSVVGGSSVVNYLDCFRTPDALLYDWVKRFGLSELTPERMRPRFEKIEEILHVRKLPVANLNVNNDLLRRGTEALGWQGDTFHRNAKDCYGSGFCDLGCSYNAKQSAALTFVPLATAKGATLLTDARVDAVLHAGDRATGVVGALLDDTRQPRGHFRIDADLVVVSGGAIHTPYLLLSSGVDDPSGQLGRNFWTHPGTPVCGWFPGQRVANYEGIKQGWYIGEFSDVIQGHPVGALIEGIGAPPGITATIFPGLGIERQKQLSRYNEFTAAGILLRDRVPGRIGVGKGRPSIDWSLAPEDAYRMRLAVARCAEAWLAAGASAALTGHSRLTTIRSVADLQKLDHASWNAGDVALFCFHQMGTARMAASRSAGVVSPTGRMWAYENLYVADSSLFPTASGVNPQLTIYALADVVADGILSEAVGAQLH